MLAALIVIPCLGAAALAAVPARRESAVRVVAAGTAGTTLVLAFLALLAVRPGPTPEAHRLVERAIWIPTIGAEWFVGVDGIRAALLLVVAVVGVAAVLADRVPSRARLAGVLVLTASLLGTVVALDLLLLVGFWSVALLATWTLSGASRRLVPVSFAGVGALVVAAAMVRARAGTFDLTVLAAADPFVGAPVQETILLVLLLVGFAAPAGIFPLHRPLAEAVAGSTTAGAAVLAGGLARSASLGVLLVAIPLAPAAAARGSTVLAALGAAGVLAGAIRAWRSTTARDVAASLVPLNAGLALLAAAAAAAGGGREAPVGFLLLLVGQGLASALLVLVADAVAMRGEPRGLLRTSPVLGVLVGIALLAAIGFPGAPGFPGSVLTLVAAARTLPFVAVVTAVGLVAGAAAILRAAGRILLDPGGSPGPGLGAEEAAPLFLLTAATALFGLLPSLLLLRAAAPIARLVAGLTGGG